ncbi:hypothetical protein [Paenibacillus sp. GP183]|uniref:hypothetical protein n=1 Tax=Paenibacillus sp. GP183 TaxID=1882751 RepID=UPI00089AC162|nr:hypothetical protein [Paenibacillus sp. GP183]SEC70354.1 hypothetical protein SAMN05443246_5061 [Paenibacillus sp. GP183]
MKRFTALIRRSIRNRYWIIYSMPLWDQLRRLIDLYFKKQQSYDVDGNLFNFLFLSPIPILVLADSRVWNRTAERMPEGYAIPDRDTLQVLLEMSGDYYGELFSNHKPMYGVYVDSSIWKSLKNALPEQYVIPDPSSIRILEPMRGDFYNFLFTSSPSLPGIVVDGKVWRQISTALPADFRLPDFTTVDILNQNKQGVGK